MIERLTVDEMRRWLKWYDDNTEQDLKDAQKERRDKLEWSLNNADKLRVAFAGIPDQSALNEARQQMLFLGYSFEPGHNPFTEAAKAVKH